MSETVKDKTCKNCGWIGMSLQWTGTSNNSVYRLECPVCNWKQPGTHPTLEAALFAYDNLQMPPRSKGKGMDIKLSTEDLNALIMQAFISHGIGELINNAINDAAKQLSKKQFGTYGDRTIIEVTVSRMVFELTKEVIEQEFKEKMRDVVRAGVDEALADGRLTAKLFKTIFE